MALKGTTFEGGTAGSALSTSNPPTSGSDTAFNTVTVTGAATATVSNADSMHGTKCMESVQTSTTSSVADGIYSGYTATSAACRFYFKFTTLPSGSNVIIMRSFNTSAARWLSVAALSTGFLRLQLTNTDVTTYTSTASMSANTWYRVEWSATLGNSNNAVVNFQWYLGDSTTPMDAGLAITNGNTGTGTAMADFRYGIITSTQAITLRVDDVAQNDGTTTFIGPAVTSVTLADTGSASDTLTAAAAVPLADTAAGADSLTATASAAISDTGVAVDAVTVTAATTQADSATGVDGLTVTTTTALADSATGSDAVNAAATLTVADASAAVDAFQSAADVALADTATAADSLTVTVTTTLDDTAAALDGFTSGAIAPPRDVTITVTTGHDRWTLTTAADRWAETTSTSRWAAATSSGRWATSTGRDRWAATTAKETP